MVDINRLRAENAELRNENERLRRGIDRIAQALRGDLYASSINEAIRELNQLLSSSKRVSEICFGTVSLGALQREVRHLASLIGCADSFLPIKHIDTAPAAPIKRQPLDGKPVGL